MTVLVRLVVGIAALKCATALAVAAMAGNIAPAPLIYSTYQYALLIVAFGATGVLLVEARTRDVRAVWLGGILAVTAAPLAETVVGCCAGGMPFLRTVGRALERVPVTPVLPLFYWLFVRDFPGPATSGPERRVARVAAAIALSLGLALLVSNLSEFVWPLTGEGALDAIRAILSRRSVGSLFWLLITVTSVPALGFLAWKVRRMPPADRRSVRIFVAGLLLGFLPVSLDMLLVALVPAYSTITEQAVWTTYVIFISLAAVPFVTAYAVLVDRVVEIRLVIRSALQYALAKYTLLALIALPLVGLAWYLYLHRGQSLLDLISRSAPLLIGLTVVAAALMLTVRHRALNALDRRFFREHYDARQILTALAERCRAARTVDELIHLVCREVDRALHLDYVTVLLATPDGSVFRSPDGRIRPLSRTSGLALLAHGDTTPLLVDLDTADSTLRRLPEEERLWLTDAGFGLLVPLRAGDGSLLGLFGLGRKRSELPYSREDRLLLEAIGMSVALTVENRRLRDSASVPPVEPARPVRDRQQDDGRAAGECETCGRVYPADVVQCDCGSALEAALVPYVLAGKFQVDRRLGRGGMGVVYRALDLDLGRHVAIKTLPHIRADDIARLRREAKTMAAVHHENLAIIYGAEAWHGRPMLVVELLAGGMLSVLLRKGPLSVARALDMGIALAKGVNRLHQAGILHCDIKPSNIGFTSDETPKLLDFGLATIRREAIAGVDSTTRSGRGAQATGTPSGAPASHVAGTPLYMSPEALQNATPRPSFDVWGLSVVLFETIAGVPPFRGSSLAAVADAVLTGVTPDLHLLRRDCPPEVAAFFCRALSRQGADRPASAADLGACLAVLRRA